MTHQYTLIILAGGRGSRMGGADKGLVPFQGKPLVARLLEQLEPAPSHTIISANRNQQTYRQWADTVVSDVREGLQGPMAGLEAALGQARGPCICLPCDLINPPTNIISRLLQATTPERVAVIEDPQRRQPLCLGLYPDLWLSSLSAYLDEGGRSAHGWLKQIHCHAVPVKTPLTNLNRLPQ